MGHAKTFKNAAPGKKEKIFHPQSRKADQIARSNLRKDKLAAASSKRNKRDASQVDVYAFFFHALPPEGTLTLPDIHALVQDSWLTRHDAEIAEEKSQRRPGRPKSMREMRLGETKLREAEEYRSGLEVIDLTHPENVDLFRRWDQLEAAYVQMLRFIRISKENPTTAIVTRPGKHMDINPHAISNTGQGKKDKAFVPKKRMEGAVTIRTEPEEDDGDVPMLIETS